MIDFHDYSIPQRSMSALIADGHEEAARVFLRRAPGGDDDGVIEHLSDELARDLDTLRASLETPRAEPLVSSFSSNFQDDGRVAGRDMGDGSGLGASFETPCVSPPSVLPDLPGASHGSRPSFGPPAGGDFKNACGVEPDDELAPAFGELPERLKAGLQAEALDAIGMIVAEPVRLLLSCIVAHDGSVSEALSRAICHRFEVIGLAKMAGKAGRGRPA